MNTFSLVQKALNESAKDTSKADLDFRTIEAGRVLHAVQTVVDALTPPDGGRYVVGFADITSAGTNLTERRIIVSSKPLRDSSLTLVEKAVLLVTFAAHEIGHTIVTRPRKALVQEHSSSDGFHACANLSDDIILEPVMVDRFPILADAFEWTGLWLMRQSPNPLPKVQRMVPGMETAARFNVLVNATRYGDIPEVVWFDDRARAERDWARDWAKRLKALRLTDHTGFLLLCDEAWVRIRSDENLPEPEPQPAQGGDEGEPEPSEDESDEQGEPGSEGDAEEGEDDDDADDDADGDDDGDDESDDAHDATDDATDDESGEDEPGDGDGESEDGDGDEGDEGEGEDGSGDADGEGEGEGPGQPDPSITSFNDDDDDDGESDEDGESEDGEGTDTDGGTGNGNDDGAGGGGNSAADSNTLRDENDFDKSDVEETTHDSSEGNPLSIAAEDAEDRVRQFASATTTTFGKHGSLPTIWS